MKDANEYIYHVFCSKQYDERVETRFWLIAKLAEFYLGLRSWYRLDPRCVNTIWTTRAVLSEISKEDFNAL